MDVELYGNKASHTSVFGPSPLQLLAGLGPKTLALSYPHLQGAKHESEETDTVILHIPLTQILSKT